MMSILKEKQPLADEGVQNPDNDRRAIFAKGVVET
jgi:hypothetical protein